MIHFTRYNDLDLITTKLTIIIWVLIFILGTGKAFRESTWLHRSAKHSGKQILLNDTSRKRRRKDLVRKIRRKLNLSCIRYIHKNEL